MLSDEEKKTIEYLKHHIIPVYGKKGRIEYLLNDVVLNLIEKQSKEIEELKNITKSYDSFLGTEKIVIADKKFFVNGYFRENYVSKDKIKAKIDELDKQEEDLQNSISNEEREEYSDANISWELMDIQIRREVLQSLLEKE